jgi:hypothetical protein
MGIHPQIAPIDADSERFGRTPSDEPSPSTFFICVNLCNLWMDFLPADFATLTPSEPRLAEPPTRPILFKG